MSNTVSGGVFFHAVIQGRNITVVLPPEITPALSGLPPASATFTGRTRDLDYLLDGLKPSEDRQEAVLVAAVAGLAGVGKTELVIQTATRALREPGWFPGGVLFTDLHGYDIERRLEPERVLDGWLRALGIPAKHIPLDLPDRTRLYRSVLAAYAAQGRRILVVIDNASTAEQARSLLPTDGTTAALITSRHTLDLDARLHDLDALTEAASTDLLCRALRQARGPGDTRIDDEPEHAMAIARLCAGLPLALRIAAALLADTPTRPLASLATALADTHTRLHRLRRQDVAVRAAFDLSYQHLEPAQARLFRLVPLNAGPDLSTETAAHLVGSDSADTEELLQDLARAHLIEPAAIWGRWRLHDLVRLYADQLGEIYAEADQRDAAQSRLHDHYCTAAAAANSHLNFRPGLNSPRFSGRDGALVWLDTERHNLTATVIAPPPLGRPGTSTDLAFTLVTYLHYRRHFDDWLTVTTTALAISRELGDRGGEGTALNNLGFALREVRRFDDAIDALIEAVGLFRELGDRDGEGVALNNLGLALREVRRFEDAFDAHIEAVGIFRELGDRLNEGQALGNLGSALKEVRRFEEAIDAHTQNVAIFRELSDRHREGRALNRLGITLREVRRFEDAIDALTEAVGVFRELGDRHSEGQALGNLGSALTGVKRFEDAIRAHTQAVGIFRELSDRHRERWALWNTSVAHNELWLGAT